MKVLLVYPRFPETFWSFKYALKLTMFKKATHPPLGLLTVASMLPEEWEKKLVDMNVRRLRDKDIEWADMVFISAMYVQRSSAEEVISRCKRLGVRVVAGGPLFTHCYNEFDQVDHLVLNEGEITLPPFLEDLERGCAEHIYKSDGWADMERSPTPLWGLVDMNRYVSASVQYSRGCPFNCDFCDITFLYGHKPRLKTSEQIVAELDAIYSQGWRESVFFVDDNFIGNRKRLKQEVLPAIVSWQEERGHPFSFLTQASVDLVDDEDIMKMMVEAGFDTVFLGIETPDEESLKECKKYQNRGRDLVACVKKIQSFGMQVMGGFIVGFDNDTTSIFQRQIKFIQESGIVTAMVGILNVLRGTKLYNRLKGERRLFREGTGDNTDCSVNFKPKMGIKPLIDGYRDMIKKLYSPDYYYERVKTFLRGFRPPKKLGQPRFCYLVAFLRSIVELGLRGRERLYYWKIFFWTLFTRPRLLPVAVTLSIQGFHFRRTFERY